MKKILCLTDLSEKSKAGIYFANELARRQNATLIFMHTFKTVKDSTQGLHPSLYEYSDTASRNILYNLCIDFRRNDRYSSVNYEYMVQEGTVADNLNPTIHRLGIDLVVLSVEGQLKKEHAHYNSILKFIVQEAECPVLVVPTACKFEEIHELVYAMELEDTSVVNPEVLQFADDFKAHLRLVTFVKDSGDRNSDILFNRFNKIRNNTGYNRLAFEIREDENVSEGINKFCAMHNAQIVVMENHSRSEFDKVNNPSFTGRFLYNSHYPVLICNKVRETVSVHR
jgi:nucleotide-binding universal stress UspA family protein